MRVTLTLLSSMRVTLVGASPFSLYWVWLILGEHLFQHLPPNSYLTLRWCLPPEDVQKFIFLSNDYRPKTRGITQLFQHPHSLHPQLTKTSSLGWQWVAEWFLWALLSLQLSCISYGGKSQHQLRRMVEKVWRMILGKNMLLERFTSRVYRIAHLPHNLFFLFFFLKYMIFSNGWIFRLQWWPYPCSACIIMC